MEAWWIGADTPVRGAFWYDDGKGWRAYHDPGGPPYRGGSSHQRAWPPLSAHRHQRWRSGGSGSTVRSRAPSGTEAQAQRCVATLRARTLGKAAQTSGIAAASRIDTAMEIWWAGPKGSVEGGYYYATDTEAMADVHPRAGRQCVADASASPR